MTWLMLQMLVKVKFLGALSQLSIFHQLNILRISDCKMRHICLKAALTQFKQFMSYVDLITTVISLNHLRNCSILVSSCFSHI